MTGKENLIPMNKRTKEEQRKIAKKGAKKSIEVRKQKKLMRDQINLLLSLPLKDEKAIEKLKSLGIDTNNIDNQMAMMISIWNKALKGDVQAFTALRDTVGEKPIDKVEQITPPKIEDDV